VGRNLIKPILFNKIPQQTEKPRRLTRRGAKCQVKRPYFFAPRALTSEVRTIPLDFVIRICSPLVPDTLDRRNYKK
jgi:hypothetical protein